MDKFLKGLGILGVLFAAEKYSGEYIKISDKDLFIKNGKKKKGKKGSKKS